MLPCYNIILVRIWILILTFECYIGILGVYRTIARCGTNSHFLFVCIYVSADCRLGLTFTAACAPHCCVINHTCDIHWSLSHLFYGQQWQAFFIFTLCPLPQPEASEAVEKWGGLTQAKIMHPSIATMVTHYK